MNLWWKFVEFYNNNNNNINSTTMPCFSEKLLNHMVGVKNKLKSSFFAEPNGWCSRPKWFLELNQIVLAFEPHGCTEPNGWCSERNSLCTELNDFCSEPNESWLNKTVLTLTTWLMYCTKRFLYSLVGKLLLKSSWVTLLQLLVKVTRYF